MIQKETLDEMRVSFYNKNVEYGKTLTKTVKCVRKAKRIRGGESLMRVKHI